MHVNSSEISDETILKQNQKTIEEFENWKRLAGSKIKYYLIHSRSLPKKHAGVGLARKIVMDEAAWRFSEINNVKGIIVCLDSDCTVDQNYLQAIETHFSTHEKATGCSIRFEHPLEGKEFKNSIYYHN